MGNNKKGSKASVFKVAGAKSLKKPKSKQVNLGLKNIKNNVEKIDKQFLAIQKNTNSNVSVEKCKKVLPIVVKQNKKKDVKKETAEALEKLDKMEM